MVLGTPVILQGKGITQVVDNKMVCDTGFEPVTSLVCKRHKKRGKRKKYVVPSGKR
jgi:ribonucleotide reductase alpha subunit